MLRIPEYPHHFAVGAKARVTVAASYFSRSVSDCALEKAPIRLPVDSESGERFRGIQADEPAFTRGGFRIDAHALQSRGECFVMFLSGDYQEPFSLAPALQQVSRYASREQVLV
jgi:hypothetical protein